MRPFITYHSILLTAAGIAISGLLLFSGCEKDITVDLPEAEPKLVIEGYVIEGEPTRVFISRTTSFFASTDSLALIESAVKGAKVIVSDGVISDTLAEPIPALGYFYLSTSVIGEIGKTYSLEVITKEGERATSSTTINPPVQLDSVWFLAQPELDSLGWAWARLSDPPDQKNYYRWFAKRIGKDDDFIAPFGSVSEDRFYNGLTFDFAYGRGQQPNSNEEDDNNDEAGWFKTGDTIAVKFASITRESFDFWRSAESQTVSNGNPFSAPAPLKSNIEGGIGIWEGFSFTLDTIYTQ
jgi:hypothetical protein